MDDCDDIRSGAAPPLAGSRLITDIPPVELLDALATKGYIILDMSESLVRLTAEVFNLFKMFDMRSKEEKNIFELTPNALGENNGYHGVGGLSKYNRCREGYIFQASSPIWTLLSDSRSAGADAFSQVHEEWRAAVHELALQALDRLGQALDLPHPSTYFSPGGSALDIITGSQFHVKKVSSDTIDPGSIPRATDGEFVTMPAHCDPSVVSIVIHALITSGLQVRDVDKKAFVDIPPTGPSRCVLLAGTLLEQLTDAAIKPCVHRVVSSETDLVSSQRIAASFFFQPTLDSILIPFAASTSPSRDDAPVPLTYGKWKSRVYGNYYKGRKAEA